MHQPIYKSIQGEKKTPKKNPKNTGMRASASLLVLELYYLQMHHLKCKSSQVNKNASSYLVEQSYGVESYYIHFQNAGIN